MTDIIKEVDNINDEAYFEYLLCTYQKLVYAICYKAVGNQFDAEDLTQDVYIAVYKNLSTFDRSYEKAWICKIASNKCLDFLKSAKRKVQPAEEEVFLQMEDKQDGPEKLYLNKEAKVYVYEVCQKLKEPYRTVATEHFYREKSVAEIAQEKGKNVKTIQTQIYRAKAMLKKTVKEERT